MNTDIENMGKRIKETRLQKGLKHIDIYEKCGIASGAMSMIENGKRMPSAITLYNIAKVLDVSIDWLITGNSTNIEKSEIYGVEKDLLISFRKLDIDNQEEVMEFIKMKVQRSNKKKERIKSSNYTEMDSSNKVS